MLPTFPTKALSLTHVPSQAGHECETKSVTAMSSERLKKKKIKVLN